MTYDRDPMEERNNSFDAKINIFNKKWYEIEKRRKGGIM